MHRIARYLAVLLAIMLLASFAPAHLTSLGQEATPRSGDELFGCIPTVESPETEDTVDSQFLAKGDPNEPGGRVIFLYQYTFEPSPEDQPGIPRGCYAETVLAYVNQGSDPDALTIVVHEGAIQVRRDAGTPGTSLDLVTATPGGTTVTLGPNDSFFSTGADYSLGNHSDQTTILTVSVLAQDGAPGGNPTWPT